MQIRESTAQEALVSAAVEQGGFEAKGGEMIALGLEDALNEPVQAQAAQVIAHASGADLGLGDAEQLRKPWPQLAITQALGLEAKQNQHRQQCLHPLLAKRQRGDMLAVDLGRFLKFSKRLSSDVAVVGELLDLEHAPIGGEADLAQGPSSFTRTVTSIGFGTT